MKDQELTITQLLDGGVHWGHKQNRWNPKMLPYIYGISNGVHIINLQQTLGLFKIALQAIHNTVKKNGRILFVATKQQARESIAQCAEKCGQYYVNHRWLGGMLTNWQTVSKSIKKLEKLEKSLESQQENSSIFTKKELLDITRKRDKLIRSLGGIRKIGGKPDLLVIIDSNKESLAITEAKKLSIPIVAILDTNSDPDGIDYPVPGNDDAIKSINLYCELFSNAVLAGIEDSLIASGVDIGASLDQGTQNKNFRKITKLKGSKKVTKSTVENDTQNQEFEQYLGNNLNNQKEKTL